MTTREKSRYIDRLFNIRPICFWSFFVGLTIAICLGFGTRPWVIGVYFAVLIGVFVVLQFLKCRDKVLTFFGTSRINFVVTIALCLVVALSFGITTLWHTNQRSFAGFADLSGVVERHNIREDGTGWFILDNVKFGEVSVSGRVAVYINNPNETTLTNVTSTYRITVNTQLRTASASNFNVNNGIRYTANINERDIVTEISPDRSPRNTVLRHANTFLARHMSSQNAGLMFAMLFGDRSTLDDEVSESFSLTGIAHVLAVSGLHVGILVGMLLVLLKICRVPRKYQIPIIAVVLLIYCYLCGFRYSILRASIMFMVFVIRRAFLKSNDMLSSISLAAIVILALFPYSLMSVSFQFTFACMLGIALFIRPFTNFFRSKLKLPKWLSNSLAIYLATFLAVLPLMLRYFGFVSLLGVITNVLFLPLLVLAFQATLVAVLTWIGFPLLYPVNIALNGIISVTHWLASLPFSHIEISSGGYWFLLYFLGLIFTTRFIFLRRRWKYPIAAILILIFATSVIVYSI
jgi:ComEC/Rec2-related protein